MQYSPNIFGATIETMGRNADASARLEVGSIWYSVKAVYPVYINSEMIQQIIQK